MLVCGRRDFLRRSVGLAGLGLLAGCSGPVFPWNQRSRPYRIGYLSLSSAEPVASSLAAFREGMRALGYVEGQTYTLDVRLAEGREERLDDLAAALVRSEVDVLLTGGTEPIQASMRATSTIPIVFATSGNPVVRGFVASLARPGGNVTGITQEGGQESTKRLDLLTEAFPTISRIGILWTQGVADGFRQTDATARAKGLQPVSLEAKDPDTLPTVLATAIEQRVDALAVQAAALFTGPRAQQIVEFAQQHRLPAMYGATVFVDAGGLLVYGPNFIAQYHRAASYVDKILKGAKPADLPVEGPTRYDFVVNLRTAQATGLTIPPSVLAQASEVKQ